MSRSRVFIFGAVLAATVILAVLGYVSLRQWQSSADLLFREQSRDMVTMAAEKVEMAILKAEEESLSSLQVLLMDAGLPPEALEDWRGKHPLFDRVTLIDRQGHVLYPAGGGPPAILREIPEGLWDRGGRRHLVVGDQVVLAAVIPGAAGGPVLAVLGRSVEGVKRDVLEKTLGGLAGPCSTRRVSPCMSHDRSTTPTACSRSLSATRCPRGALPSTSRREPRHGATCGARPCSSWPPSSSSSWSSPSGWGRPTA